MTEPERLAIVGSRSLAGNPEVEALIERLLIERVPAMVVSGGAVGVDGMARECAERLGIPVVEFKPERPQWDGPGGYAERNQRIANECTALVCIVAADSRTRGSRWTRDRAKELGKPTFEFVIG